MTNFRCREARMTHLDEFQDDNNVVIYSSDLHHFKFKTKVRMSPRMKINLTEGSLFRMCLKYITMNYEKLDSLIGFPEMIGRQLFEFMVTDGLFSTLNCESKYKLLKIFSDAYKEILLNSLTLYDINLRYMDNLLQCFGYLQELDLTNQIVNNSIMATMSSMKRQALTHFCHFVGLSKKIIANPVYNVRSGDHKVSVFLERWSHLSFYKYSVLHFLSLMVVLADLLQLKKLSIVDKL